MKNANGIMALWHFIKTLFPLNMTVIQKKVVSLRHNCREDAFARQSASTLALLSLNRIFANSNN